MSLRTVAEGDLPIFFDQQLDPEATRLAAFPSRDRESFMAHWAKTMLDETVTQRTIVFEGRVAGNIVCWRQSDELRVGYWLGREYWGQGIASAALSQFLEQVTARPLVARVAKSNVASVRVLQKCGFTITGEARFPVPGGAPGEEYILALGAMPPAPMSDTWERGDPYEE